MTWHGNGPTHDECCHVYVTVCFCGNRLLPNDIYDWVHEAVDNAENFFLVNSALKHFKTSAKVKNDPAGTLQDCVIFPNKIGPEIFLERDHDSHTHLIKGDPRNPLSEFPVMM